MATLLESTGLSMEALGQAAECLRTLAHPTRLRIVQLLLEGEHTVGELAEACGVTSAATSGHLGLMRDRGLLNQRRHGRRIYYRIRQRALAGIMSCVERSFGNGRHDE
jgi:DNA-binding transcriptional ArsR family regulator